MSLTPQVRWAQRKDRIFLKIDVNDVKDLNVSLHPEGKISFTGVSGGHKYALDLELLHEIEPQQSKYEVRPRYVDFIIIKKKSGPYWERLLKDSTKKNFLAVDWNHWKDEDEDEDEDFDNFSGPPGGGMGNFDMGEGDESSSDDEALGEEPGSEKNESEQSHDHGAHGHDHGAHGHDHGAHGHDHEGHGHDHPSEQSPPVESSEQKGP
jgi:prostaglandin-E synthase